MVETRGTKRKQTVSNSIVDTKAETPVASDGEEAEYSEERPKKRTTKRKSRASVKGSEDGQNGTSSSSSCVPPAKPMHRRRLVGRLANMMSMPTDVFCEIAHYLGPDDLLRLSRAAKTLRELLLSKSSKPIWHAAEEAIGVPECPPDLSSPQFASFIFDTFCSFCLKARAFKHDVIFRVRLCKSCSSAQIRRGFEVPLYNADDRKSREMKEIFSLVLGKPRPIHCADDPYPQNLRYYIPALEEAFRRYSSLGTVAQKKYLHERHEICRQIDLGSRALENWLLDMKNSKANENYTAKVSRRDDIFRKLEELGYHDDDFEIKWDNGEWKWKSLIEQPRELTERIWNNIRPQLEETIRVRREKRRQIQIEQRRESLVELARPFMSLVLDGKRWLVSAQELLELPLAVQEIYSTEPGFKFSRTVWESLKVQILELGQTRMRDIEQQCASMVLDGRRKSGTQTVKNEQAELGELHPHNDAAICQLAISFFIWGSLSDGRLEDFDGVIREICSKYMSTLYRYNRYNLNDPFKWTFHSVVTRSPTALVDALYKSVSVDAKTQSDMKALDISFVCLCCDPILRKLMSWTQLVQHFYEEIKDVERRESRRSASNMVTNVNDHDETRQIKLAAYTGTSLRSSGSKVQQNEDLKQWIQTCECEMCNSKSFRYEYATCGECKSLGSYMNITFSCHNKLNAHSQAKHPKQP